MTEIVNMHCTYCGSRRHMRSLCPHTEEGFHNRTYMRCTYCNKTDHDIPACPELVLHEFKRDVHHYVKD